MSLGTPTDRAVARARKHGDPQRLRRDRERVAAEPWREYFSFRPDDMPSAKGSPAALLRIAQELRTSGEGFYEQVPLEELAVEDFI